MTITTSQKTTAGEYRKQIYSIIQNTIGRNLTDNEHVFLSNLLKNYVNSYAPTEPLFQQPIEHHYVCLKCRGVITGKGRDFSHRMNRQVKKSKLDDKTGSTI